MTDEWICNVTVGEGNTIIAYGNIIYPLWLHKWTGPPQKTRSGSNISQEELKNMGLIGLYGFEIDKP